MGPGVELLNENDELSSASAPDAWFLHARFVAVSG
jgi:hypothetical protein